MQPPRKRIQNNDRKGDSGSQKNNEEDARNVYQKPARAKEQTKMNNTLEGINSRATEAEEWINLLEDRMVEITATEENREERVKRNEDTPRDLWDNIKCTNICIMGSQEEKRERKGLKKNI